jgi:hypothetical protein
MSIYISILFILVLLTIHQFLDPYFLVSIEDKLTSVVIYRFGELRVSQFVVPFPKPEILMKLTYKHTSSTEFIMNVI